MRSGEIATRTQRLYIAAVSSFFTKLVRWQFVESNPFHGSERPKINRARKLKVPTEHQIEQLRTVIKSRLNASGSGSTQVAAAAEKLLVVVDLLIETGIRIGAIPTLKIASDSRFTGVSKGAEIRGRVSGELLARLKLVSPQDIIPNTIQVQLNRITKDFSAHSFRHFAAVREYQRTKDVYFVKEFLCHKSVTVTENYLKSLDILES